ncbi:Uncharacterized protein HZ326_1694 [Fusarium oxysporum f. sp. albedinis]|nr:Uncharacterized protein HZ326_1694 [Fusarium oxysporum f. sp. albedinis]
MDKVISSGRRATKRWVVAESVAVNGVLNRVKSNLPCQAQPYPFDPVLHSTHAKSSLPSQQAQRITKSLYDSTPIQSCSSWSLRRDYTLSAGLSLNLS